MPQKFLTAEWKNLVMANYIINPDLLRPWLPAKTEIDLFNGHAYVSLVGFMFCNTRLLGMKIPWHINFEEVNLRFYVRHFHNGMWRRGVVFIKEIVPKPAIVIVANTLYKEKYQAMPMKHAAIVTNDELQLEYQWKFQQQWNTIAAVTDLTAVPMLKGSEEEFIAEHYYGYSRYNSSVTYEYTVDHPCWEVYPVRSCSIQCRFGDLYGQPFSFLETATPSSVFVAKGSAVAVLHKRKL
jgi:uncharacterized protein